MTFAIEWLALHIFGVLVAFALLVIVFRKEDTNYKGELILTIACCLVTLVAKSIYIAGGQKETLIFDFYTIYSIYIIICTIKITGCPRLRQF